MASSATEITAAAAADELELLVKGSVHLEHVLHDRPDLEVGVRVYAKRGRLSGSTRGGSRTSEQPIQPEGNPLAGLFP